MRLFLKYWLAILLVFGAFTSFAQLHETGTPSAKQHHLEMVNPLVLSIDTVFSQQKKNEKREVLPLQAGVTIPFSSRNIQLQGRWHKTDDGYYIWRAAVEVTGAKAVNFYLRDLNLNKGDKLFAYSPDYKEVLGAFTRKNNASFFAVGLINGENIVIEYDTRIRKSSLPFEIAEVGVVLKSDRGFGGAGPCEVPVNCAEGNDWKVQKRAVARVLVKQGRQTFWCSGSLVNNTKQKGAPYFLTANHCGDGSTVDDYNQWLFDFDFESPDCNRPSSAPDKITFTGAKLLAHGQTPRGSSSDFKLLLLNEEVPDEYHMFFNGWDRSGDVPQHGVVIHHPQGDIKFISTYTEPAVSSFYYGSENSTAPFWKVTWSETENGYGVTEGGSSGSPLFNEEQLIVGTLTGGNASCNNKTEPDYFGKFSEAWDKNGSNPSEQLMPWLDPDNTGVVKLEGYFKGNNIIEAKFSSDVRKIISGSYVKFSNLSTGNIKSYHWEFEGGEPSGSDEKHPELIYYEHPGSYKVTLIATSFDNADTLVQNDYINVIGNIYPNPFVKGGIHSKVYILTGDTPLSDAKVYVSDVMGRLVKEIIPQTDERQISFDPFYLDAGTYVITTIIDGRKASYKLVVINSMKE